MQNNPKKQDFSQQRVKSKSFPKRLVNNKQKITLIVASQITLIVASFLSLVYIENEWLVIGNSIDQAGLNRYLTSSAMLEAHDFVFSHTSDIEQNSIDKLRKNLEILRDGIDNEEMKLHALPLELTEYWNQVYSDFVIFEQDMINLQSSSDEKIQLLNKLDNDGKKLIESSDVLVGKISDFLEEIDILLIQLQLFLLAINSIVHVFLIVLIFRILNKDAEEKLRLEKLAVIGKIGANIAHDLMNPLTVIKGSLEILRIQKDKSENFSEEKQYKKINESVAKIEYLTKDILDFSRITELKKEKRNFLEIVQDSLNEINLPSQIDVILPKEDFKINVDKLKFQIVISNILKNAIEAIDEKGYIKISIKKESNNNIITIEDSGKGFDQKNIEKLFAPLFTTKSTGTGLGLASCKRIIEQHNGKITINQNPTRFIISIPK